MHNTLTPPTKSTAADWSSLRQVVAETPGFQHWCNSHRHADGSQLDELIQLYLRETLETLAY
jgi:hypothetical protein